MVIFLILLSPPEESFAQSVDSHDKTACPVEDHSLDNGQDDLVAVEPSSLLPFQAGTSPVILEKSEDTSHKEGIGDAFSQDHRDRFHSKDERRPLPESRIPNEKINKAPSVEEKPDD